MNETTIDAIQIDEDILTDTVSDEALEAAAGTGSGGHLGSQFGPLTDWTCC
jgi:hypothetical protein